MQNDKFNQLLTDIADKSAREFQKTPFESFDSFHARFNGKTKTFKRTATQWTVAVVVMVVSTLFWSKIILDCIACHSVDNTIQNARIFEQAKMTLAPGMGLIVIDGTPSLFPLPDVQTSKDFTAMITHPDSGKTIPITFTGFSEIAVPVQFDNWKGTLTPRAYETDDMMELRVENGIKTISLLYLSGTDKRAIDIAQPPIDHSLTLEIMQNIPTS